MSSQVRPDPVNASARAQSLSAMLTRAAERHGGKTAVVCGAVTWSYADFHREIERLVRIGHVRAIEAEIDALEALAPEAAPRASSTLNDTV